jgi:4-hydroxy-3-methylbut-2-enyl diphosphate reductase
MQLQLEPLTSSDPTGLIAIHRGAVTFLVASHRGFCYGVKRALRMAREALSRYPGRRLFLTSPILHNPRINAGLKAAGVLELGEAANGGRRLGSADVVILPAFGVSPGLRANIERSGATIVDTTCSSVMNVWVAIDRFVRDDFTVLYHGRRGHEETEVTLARLARGRRQHPYAIVQNLEETDWLAAFLEGALSSPSLLEKLAGGTSPGFDPDRDLERIGFASQTTMMARESLAIARRLRKAQAARFPAAPAKEHFRRQNTICGATAERQVALETLLAEPLDLVLVVGGHQSSNTAHLAEVARAHGRPAYHIEDATALVSARRIRHRLPRSLEKSPEKRYGIVESHDWLPRRKSLIGLTSGASTPDATLIEVLERVAELARAEA